MPPAHCGWPSPESRTHEAGNARAKGGVEGGNNIVETQFECRLRFEPVDDVEGLNRAATAWSEAYNANLIPGQDTRLRRTGLSMPVARYDLWQLIKSAETPPEAREGLIARYRLSEIQAQAILDLRLQKLTGMERLAVEQEHAELAREIERLSAQLYQE